MRAARLCSIARPSADFSRKELLRALRVLRGRERSPTRQPRGLEVEEPNRNHHARQSSRREDMRALTAVLTLAVLPTLTCSLRQLRVPAATIPLRSSAPATASRAAVRCCDAAVAPPKKKERKPGPRTAMAPPPEDLSDEVMLSIGALMRVLIFCHVLRIHPR